MYLLLSCSSGVVDACVSVCFSILHCAMVSHRQTEQLLGSTRGTTEASPCAWQLEDSATSMLPLAQRTLLWCLGR